MKTNLLLFLGLVAAGSLAACGGGGGGSIDLEDLPDELEQAQCESAVRCGEAPDLETCLASSFSERDDNLKTLSNAVAAGTIEYHGDLAADCLSAFSDYDCTYSGSQELLDALAATCDGTFEGTVGQGGVCVVDDECAANGDCVPDPTCTMACCVGTCGPPETPPVRVEIGGDCSINPNCVDGAYCHNDFVAGTAICQTQVQGGGVCEDFDACASPNLCNFDLTTGMGTCSPLPDTGEACMSDGGLPCDHQDDFCNGGTCTRRGGAGAACTSDYECLDYTQCDGTTCVARPVEGEACVNITGPSCLGDLECNAGICAAPADEPGCPIGT